MMPRVLVPSRPDVLPGTLVDWRRILARHYKRLSRTSRLRRFMAALPNSAMQVIADRASPDIVLGIEAGGRVVGVLEIFKGHDAHAEIGISIEDAYQGQGFGRALFLDGLAAAERIGVQTADLFFASENHGIRSLVSAAGGEIQQRGAECEAHIDITHCKNCRKLAADTPDQGAAKVLH
ncbi:MAG: GNAT family N-acetyltransferase [Rhodobacteraceae bacterium]|nr:GNAT family N-acetyltransferase [Paracoccaceae bacterium]